jgi:hypothetical protein
MGSDGKKSENRRRVRFERHASQIVFDPSASAFTVTWSKCGLSDAERLSQRKDPLVWLPSVAAIADLYDRGRVPQSNVVHAAQAIGRAWMAGDRDMLDTEGAKKAAELVHDLSSMCVDPSSPSVARDVGQAMRHLLDEIAGVRFMNLDAECLEEGSVLPPLCKSASECFSIPEFVSWPAPSMRRRFLFCLNKRERTLVAYTLVALLFDTGSCPLLSLSDRRTLRMESIKASGLDGDFSVDSVGLFFGHALSRMRDTKSDGRSRIASVMTQQQLSDAVSESSSN